MENKRLKLKGYLNRYPESDFSFLIPVFTNGDYDFRYLADETSGIITEFIPLYSELVLITNLPDALTDTYLSNGERALYMCIYKGLPFWGNKLILSTLLLKLIKREQISYSDQYSIYCFLNMPRKIDQSLNGVIKELEHLGLIKANFYHPATINSDLAQFADSLIYFSKLMIRSGNALKYQSLFPLTVPNGCLQFNSHIIKENVVRDHFEYLIDLDKSDIYRDLVVHVFQPIARKIGLIKDARYKLKKLIDVQQLTKRWLTANEELILNSQSFADSSVGALEVAWNISREMNEENIADDGKQTDLDTTSQTGDMKNAYISSQSNDGQQGFVYTNDGEEIQDVTPERKKDADQTVTLGLLVLEKEMAS